MDWGEFVMVEDSELGLVLAVRGWWDWGIALSLWAASDSFSEETEPKVRSACQISCMKYFRTSAYLVSHSPVPLRQHFSLLLRQYPVWLR